jgi:hypothetical protein
MFREMKSRKRDWTLRNGCAKLLRKRTEDAMRFQLSIQGDGRYAVVDVRSGQIRYCGSLDGARQAQAQLNAGGR